ncbi:DUF4262 domain-containing protein [Mycolicibacterium sp. 120270]|uniref:DUF4262 domain-containing protein n=1 Tax=Mycolicibacterium sp. 120270 TaxID=3090600 RepID=UPI00299CE8C9|nr:DUF4262 domain-containing protein [Mycolicibacterium sp. 120270]MDX1882403.1 DUF4262 domain-containing protein [Mycolicibacterium sp. 120270]
MCWQCDHPEASFADYLRELRKTITKHKWAVQYVEDERRPFAYTIGLHRRGFAEYLVTGVSPERAWQLLNSVANYTIREVQPEPGDTMNIAGEVDLEFVEVAQPDAHLCHAVNLYGRAVRALQLVWRDEHGHTPWCPDFDGGRGTQPVLGVRAPRAA